MFNTENGGQIAWLIPAALALTLAGVWVTRRRARIDGQRAAFVLWAGWLLTTLVVFSYMKGIFHAYYDVALAPAVGALVGMGGVLLWQKRRSWKAAAFLAATVAGSAWWAYVLLDRTPDFHPGCGTRSWSRAGSRRSPCWRRPGSRPAPSRSARPV